jgi:hypothetical protein
MAIATRRGVVIRKDFSLVIAIVLRRTRLEGDTHCTPHVLPRRSKSKKEINTKVRFPSMAAPQ